MSLFTGWVTAADVSQVFFLRIDEVPVVHKYGTYKEGTSLGVSSNEKKEISQFLSDIKRGILFHLVQILILSKP